jgi:hypothetical protein
MRNVEILGSHHRAMLEDQCHGRTPLALSSRYMGVFFADGWSSPRYLWIFSRGGFNEVVNFWNARARLTSWSGESNVIGVGREVLADGRDLAPLNRWLAAPRSEGIKPNLIVCAEAADRTLVRERLRELGIGEYEGARFVTSIGAQDETSPEYILDRPFLAGSIKRGLMATTTMTITPAGVAGNGGLIWPHCGGLNWPHLRPTRC